MKSKTTFKDVAMIPIIALVLIWLIFSVAFSILFDYLANKLDSVNDKCYKILERLMSNG